jgi:ankyrin repeat protein
LLREKKADANSHNKDGYTALQLAVLNQHNECLEILIKHGKANVNKRGAYVF